MDAAKVLLAELEPLENGAPPALRDLIGALRLAVNETEAVGEGNPSWQLNEGGQPIPGKNRVEPESETDEASKSGSAPV